MYLSSKDGCTVGVPNTAGVSSGVDVSSEAGASSSTSLSVREQINYFKSLVAISSSIHADASPLRRLKRAAVFSAHGFHHRHQLQRLQNVFDCPELAEVLSLFPAILEKPFNPYVSVEWDLDKRVDEIENHFHFLKSEFGANSAQLYQSSSYKLFEFTANDEEVYTIEIFPGYQSEGSVGIRLCDSSKREVYTLSFHLSQQDQRCCYIGALQGPNDNVPERQKTITMLTRSLHGLRPKALMVETMYMVANALDIDFIYAITNQGHIYQSEKYADAKRAQVVFDCDQFWGEYQAKLYSSAFFKLPAQLVRKDIASLKSKKRSLYRKRYAWLNEMEIQTDSALNELRIVKQDNVIEHKVRKVA